VVIVGDPVLHTPAARVTEFDSELAQLIEDMFASMYVAEGVGLAAPQIGVAQAVFVFDCFDDEGTQRIGHLVNPVIRSVSREVDQGDEGCLSVPGPFASLDRPHEVRIGGVDLLGQPLEVTGSGYFARCLLHEAEHLQGTLYIDHLNRRRRSRVLSEIEPAPWSGPLPVGSD